MNNAVEHSVSDTFEKIRSQALEYWQATREGQDPFILVGTATCGLASGALEVLRPEARQLDRLLNHIKLVHDRHQQIRRKFSCPSLYLRYQPD